MPLLQLFSKNFVYFWPRQHPNGNGLQLSLSSAVCEQVVTEVPSEKVCSNECPATGSWEEAGGRPREETDGNEGRYPHPLLKFTRDFLL